MQTQLIEDRDEKLGFITDRVGDIERLVFCSLTVLLYYSLDLLLLDKVKIFGAFLGGWLTLKILSSHKPWSDIIAGKAYYHTSLIGTLLNVLSGFVVGFLFCIAWFML